MTMRLSIYSVILSVFLAYPVFAVAGAPPAGAGAQPSGGGGGDRGHFGGSGADPLRFRQLAMTTIRAKLAIDDDEQWKSLWPKIEKVLRAQRNARTGASMSMSSGVMVKGTPPPNVVIPSQPPASAAGAANADASPPQRAMEQVRAALDAPATSDADLVEKLTAMRAARDAARAELAAAQKELHAACSTRQEAVFVTLGLLE
jgi:hypothetical protein